MKPLLLAAIVLALLWRSRRKPDLDVARLARAWGDVMDGRRVGSGLRAARIGSDTTTAADWAAIAHEYDDGVLPVDPYTWTMA